jgi:CspA family cold shock protein
LDARESGIVGVHCREDGCLARRGLEVVGKFFYEGGLTNKGCKIMAIGTVKWFNPDKGFGFIQPQDGGKDVFLHITAVQAAGLSNVNEAQKVSYDVVTERGKLAAANLKLA